MVDDNERYYLGKTILDSDIISQIADIIKNILQDFNQNGAHNDSCTMDNNEPCGINADRLDDMHAKDFVHLIDPDYPDNPLNNQELIRNSLQEYRVKIGKGKDLLNDQILQLDTDDIILYLNPAYPEMNDRDKAFFANTLELTHIIHTILNNLWELRHNSFKIGYDDEDMLLYLTMFNPYNSNTKSADIVLPPRTMHENGLMTPGDVQNIIDNTIEIEELWNNKLDKIPGKILSENDFTNEYREKLDILHLEYIAEKNLIRHFLITEDLYNNDSEMLVSWSELSDTQRANLSQDILDLPENERYYDPRLDPYNMYYFIDELPASYMPPQFGTKPLFEFGVEEREDGKWMYYSNINSPGRHYFLKVSDILADNALMKILDRNLILEMLKTYTNAELIGSQFLSKSIEPKINSAVQGARLNGLSVPKDSDNVLNFNNIITRSILETELSQLGTDNILNNSITASKIADNSITSSKILDNSIIANKIANNSLCTEKIGNECITNSKLSNNSITENKIVDSSITTDKIKDESITNEKVAINAGIDFSKLNGVAAQDHKHPSGAHVHTDFNDLPPNVARFILGGANNGHISMNNQLDGGWKWESGLFSTRTSTIIQFANPFNQVGGVVITQVGALDEGWINSSVQNITNSEFTANIKVYDENGGRMDVWKTFRWFAWGR
jgi:hypothetical protein